MDSGFIYRFTTLEKTMISRNNPDDNPRSDRETVGETVGNTTIGESQVKTLTCIFCEEEQTKVMSNHNTS